MRAIQMIHAVGLAACLGLGLGLAAAPVIAQSVCFGDCDDAGTVSVAELMTLLNVALGTAPIDACPGALCDGSPTVDISCLLGAVRNALDGCPATPTPTATTALPPTATPGSVPGTALGIRRFSLDPAASRFIAVLSQGFAFPSSGFTGFLELSGGFVDPQSGIALIDVTDASPYLAVAIGNGGGAICMQVQRDQLPVRNAGLIACGGGFAWGLQLIQDHNVGVAGACKDGDRDGLTCAGDGECPGGVCFDAARCAAAGGVIEPPGGVFPGVCNGPLLGALLAGDSGPGALLMSPDPVSGFTRGLPVAILQEQALPCGDEPEAGAMSTAIALTSGRGRAEVRSFNNESGSTLSFETTGENFSCTDWTREDGPGALVLTSPLLNTVAVGSATDIISAFVFDD